ncbi:hypothetical protein PAAG_01170 [Paracoccidioides lutzii Pb01]|uniref:Uncharacterized protein n=1 Tax=Paracoccidioides lutzii (strain ATCC MYA-826 / Pb01) TaxID=502779 RepID=C1GRM5_PARBA|nr:hypothetical protein PAAG_01170 [Paracoccidioides lutzii Pb01]EEH38249.1 hypothetical protein PAAG_01170 [Paracoccidioides lutzii Pb01]
MAHRRPGLSRTLPKDFTFYISDDVRPRTPEQPTKELTIPPPPHHSSCRFRRPRLTMENHRELFCSPDIPLPSIEFSHDPSSSVTSFFDQVATQTPIDNALQVPLRGRIDPRTPPAQIRGTPVDERPPWTYGGVSEAGDFIQRPSSSCSNFSDSSVASSTSYASHQSSLGESCTSPESEIQDPLLSYPPTKHWQELETPSKASNAQEVPVNIVATRSRWTTDMDSHLWNTYQIYLQDPRITPFKLVPGSLPPLGVSHRVAREARKTWLRTRHLPKAGPSPVPLIPAVYVEDRAKTGKKQETVDSTTRSGSTTPIAQKVPHKPKWPRSDASTRRRLKELCNRKFFITPHYQRLLQSRSPSPFLEPFVELTSRAPSQLKASHRRAASFATRDLGVSLVSSSLPTQVAELGRPVTRTDLDTSSDNDWFNNIQQHVQGSSRQDPNKRLSRSLDHASNTSHTFSPDPIPPRLGSPFIYHTWGPDRSHRRLRSVTPASQCETIHAATGSKLQSPGPGRVDPFGNAPHKRRALHQLEDELDSRGSSLQRPFPDLIRQTRFNDAISHGQRRVRVRNRGVTTGAISPRGRLEQLFTPPAPFPDFTTAAGASPTGAAEDDNNGQESRDNVNASDNINYTHNNINHNSHLRLGDDIKRLGSPFHSDPPSMGMSKNICLRKMTTTPTRSPRHAPSLSDPFIPTMTSASASFASLASVAQQQQCISRRQEGTENLAHTPYFERRVGMGTGGEREGNGGGSVKLDTPNTPFS